MSTSPILFGSEAEGIYRAMHNAISGNFSADGTINLDGVMIPVKQCTLVFGNQPLPESQCFSFVVNGYTPVSRHKCKPPSGSNAKFGFLEIGHVIMGVHFRCINQVSNPESSGEILARKQWSALAAVLRYSIKKLHDNGIARLEFDVQPVRLPAPSHYVLFGTMEFDTEVHHSVNIT